MDIVISEHARFEMTRRQISEQLAKEVVRSPQQVVRLKKERRICQSKFHDPVEGKEMLLRVICEERHDSLFIITAYKTSKVGKYWIKEAKL